MPRYSVLTQVRARNKVFGSSGAFVIISSTPILVLERPVFPTVLSTGNRPSLSLVTDRADVRIAKVGGHTQVWPPGVVG
jgi:hypothetical protein